MPGIIRGGYLAVVVVLVAALSLAGLSNNGTSNPSVEEYYVSWESRLGYWLLLGNARHSGYWERDTWWPFPIGHAQRAMEEKLYTRLGLQNTTSRVLDAGAGSGIVALYMAERGLQVEAIDLTPLHVAQANRNFKARGLGAYIHEQLGDYHDLSRFPNGSFDGVYTMETFVHADQPHKALSEFFRVLRPGGVLVLHEGDFHYESKVLRDVLRLSHCENMLKKGTYNELLQHAGFKDITIEDLTNNVLPLWRLFGILGAAPYEVMKFFKIEHKYTNVMAGVETYRNWDQGRYISVRAVKR